MKTILAFVAAAFLGSACGSVPIWRDETPVDVEAVVTAYAPETMHVDFADGGYATTNLFATELELIFPVPRFDRRLRVLSTRDLGAANPFARVGIRVTFTVARKYLVDALSDPTEKHDFTFLYVDAVKNLREVHPSPNQALEPTAAAVTPPAAQEPRQP